MKQFLDRNFNCVNDPLQKIKKLIQIYHFTVTFKKETYDRWNTWHTNLTSKGPNTGGYR